MSNQIETINEPATSEPTARWNFAIDEAKSLEMIQRIVGGIERAMIGKLYEDYNTAPTINAALNFKLAVTNKDAAAIEEAEALLSIEMHQWRTSLAQRDEALPAYNLRRFCERREENLDLPAFAALTRFYRSLPHTESVQSKYDFAMTRLFASVTENERRVLRLEGAPLVQSLTDVFHSWGQTELRGQTTQREADIAANGFRAFVSEAEAIDKFEDLIALNLFNRVREFKREIGEAIYSAEVTAAAIECNVALANTFSDMLISEGHHIREAPGVHRDLSELLSDTCSRGPVSELLNELQASEINQQDQSSERLNQLVRLLRISDAAEDETSSEQNGNSVGEELAAPRLLPDDVRELVDCDENKEIIAEFLAAPSSAGLDYKDLITFLAPWPDFPSPDEPSENEPSEKETRRKALSLILTAERLLQSGVLKNTVISSETESELRQFMDETQNVGSDLRELISIVRQHDQPGTIDQLLHISNQLLGARLGVQSALVRRGTSELARQRLVQKRVPTPSQTIVSIRPPRSKVRLLIAAALLVTLAIFTIHAFTVSSGVEEMRDKDVHILNHQELPGAQLLVGARVRHELLVGIVSPAWETITEDKKREELQVLLQYGASLGITTVMLVDSNGVQRGSVSNSNVIVEP